MMSTFQMTDIYLLNVSRDNVNVGEMATYPEIKEPN